jgi:hypothetical protein
MSKRKWLREGVALVTALIFLAVVVVFVSTALLVSSSNRKLSGDNLRTYQAQLAAEAGLQRVIAESWFAPYEESEHEDVPEDYQVTLETFRKQLDDTGISAGENGINSYSFGDEVIFQEDLEGASYSASVRRVDVGDSYTLLRLDVTGLTGNPDAPAATRRMSADLRVQVPQTDSQGFAVLGNNANCIFCHTQISSLEAAYDKDGNPVNFSALTTPKNREDTFKDKERVKIAFLETLLTDRVKEMQSLMTGTIYTRGTTNVIGRDNTLSAVPLKVIDKQSTSLLSSDVAKTLTELDAVDCGGRCEKRHGLFYKNYPLRNGADGSVPETFPVLIPDTNNNRQIEHTEWRDAVAKEDSSGTLKGGNKTILATKATGERDLALNSSSLKNVATLASSESVDGVQGNVILEGTATKPLVLEGTLYINGDVVLRGVITGDGKIVARGNVYITGDVTYACDDEAQDFNWRASQSKSCAYNTPEELPRLGVIAGKNILVGAYLTPATSATLKGRPTDQLTRLNFDKTSADDLAKWFIDAGTSLKEPQALSYTMVQMALFNESEYRKAKASSSYSPRFYKLRDDGTVFRCGKGFSTKKEDYCKTYAELTDLSASALTDTADKAILERATLLSATPSNAWLGSDTQTSELALRAQWVSSVEGSRPLNALHLDGLYYTPNAIFGNLPTSSTTQGKLLLNGSLAAADIALLTPAGLTINSDERLAGMLDISQPTHVTQTVSNYRLLDTDAEVDYGVIGE